jgi:poly-beta-1,6-N-acetyl-D-glucosamine synthase
MKISFIIPALNEEHNIKAVVGQFDVLKEKYDFEVIIADGGSKDKTPVLAKKAGAKFLRVPPTFPKTIASARDYGASKSNGELLIFCDADTLLDNLPYFMNVVMKTFQREKVVGGTPKLKVFKDERVWKDRIFQELYGALIKISFIIQSPISFGQCQIVRRSAFEKIGGYNIERVHAEDTELMRQLVKIGTIKYFGNLTVLESSRRYREVGYIRLTLLGFYSFVMYSILGRNVLKEWKRVG